MAAPSPASPEVIDLASVDESVSSSPANNGPSPSLRGHPTTAPVRVSLSPNNPAVLTATAPSSVTVASPQPRGSAHREGGADDRVFDLRYQKMACTIYDDILKPGGWFHRSGRFHEWMFFPGSLKQFNIKEIKNKGTQGVHFVDGYGELGLLIERYGMDHFAPESPHDFPQEIPQAQRKTLAQIYDDLFPEEAETESPATSPGDDGVNAAVALEAAPEHNELPAAGESSSGNWSPSRLGGGSAEGMGTDSASESTQQNGGERLEELQADNVSVRGSTPREASLNSKRSAEDTAPASEASERRKKTKTNPQVAGATSATPTSTTETVRAGAVDQDGAATEQPAAVGAATEQPTAVKAAIEAMQQQLQASISTVIAAANADAQIENSTLLAEKDNALASLEKMRTDRDRLMGEQTKLKGEVSKLEKTQIENSTLLAEKDNALASLEKMRADRDRLMGEQTKLKGEVSKLEKDNARLQKVSSHNERLQRTKGILKEDNERLKKQCVADAEEIKTLVDANKELEKKVEEKQREVQFLLRRAAREDAVEQRTRSATSGGVQQPAVAVSSSASSEENENETSGQPKDEAAEKLMATIQARVNDAKENIPDVKFDEIIGNEDAKKKLLHLPMCRGTGHRGWYAERRVANSQGIVFFGPPGTGKTLFAKALASSGNGLFIPISPDDILDQYHGNSEKNVRAYFSFAADQARKSGITSVMFFDECDRILGKPGKNDCKVDSNITGVFQECMNGVKEPKGQVVVLAATNFLDRLPEAILSRFGSKIKVGLPSADERIAITKLEIGKQMLTARVDLQDEDYARLAEDTEGASGRDIEMLVGNALDVQEYTIDDCRWWCKDEEYYDEQVDERIRVFAPCLHAQKEVCGAGELSYEALDAALKPTDRVRPSPLSYAHFAEAIEKNGVTPQDRQQRAATGAAGAPEDEMLEDQDASSRS